MTCDKTLLVESLEDVTLELVTAGIERAMGYGNTSDNLLFPNGDDVYVYGTEVEVPDFAGDGTHVTMRASISFRNYVGTCELLVRDSVGNHLVYNKVEGLSKEALAEEYYHEINLVRHLIDGVAESTFGNRRREMFEESRRTLGMA